LFKGVPRLETKNVGGGGVRGMNGIRECRAVSSSTVGWGGEPDRAVDQRAAATNWGSASCTHTVRRVRQHLVPPHPTSSYLISPHLILRIILS
jgi:hypothetical protein